jgi:hypothetical protein
MALKKVKTMDSGVIVEYYRVVQLNCNYDDFTANCTLAMYIDETARLAGNSPLGTLQINLANEFHNANYTDSGDVMKNISLKEAYKAIKNVLASESVKISEDEEYRSPCLPLMFLVDAEDV